MKATQQYTIIIVLLLFVYEVVVVGQTFRTISSQAGQQLSKAGQQLSLWLNLHYLQVHCLQVHCLQVHCLQVHCLQVHCLYTVFKTAESVK